MRGDDVKTWLEYLAINTSVRRLARLQNAQRIERLEKGDVTLVRWLDNML